MVSDMQVIILKNDMIFLLDYFFGNTDIACSSRGDIQ